MVRSVACPQTMGMALRDALLFQQNLWQRSGPGWGDPVHREGWILLPGNDSASTPLLPPQPTQGTLPPSACLVLSCLQFRAKSLYLVLFHLLVSEFSSAQSQCMFVPFLLLLPGLIKTHQRFKRALILIKQLNNTEHAQIFGENVFLSK